MSDWDFFLQPYSASDRGLSFALHLSREREIIRFRYLLSGSRVREIRRASGGGGGGPMAGGVRRDELWKTTCFEFFLSQPDQASYFEINMNTRGDWNAYAFSDYREGMRPAAGVTVAPLEDVRSSETSLELSGTLRLDDFPLLGPVVLGATAVLEYQDGGKEYWALAHKGAKPDFHVRSSFIATV